MLSNQICIKRLLFIKSTPAHSFLGVHLVETNPNLSVTQALHYYDTKIIHFCFIRTSSFRLRLDVHNFDTHSRLNLKISPYVCVHIKIKLWKICILDPKNSRVISPWSHFHIKTKILADFPICINVTLHVFSSFLEKNLWSYWLFSKAMLSNFLKLECGLYYPKLENIFNVYRAVRVQPLAHRRRSH